MLDAAYAAGVRYVDAARSYGRAEEFLAGWLAERGHGLPLRFQRVTDPLLVAAVQEHGDGDFILLLLQSRLGWIWCVAIGAGTGAVLMWS